MSKMRAALFAAAVVLAVPPSAFAQRDESARGTIVNINAEGSSDARPDLATVNLGVVTTGRTSDEALAENARRMQALVAALRRAGIAERDIQTSHLWASPRYERVGEDGAPQLVSYHASNSVRIKVRDIGRTGRVLESAIGAGGNTVQGVSFSHADPVAQLDAARRDAIGEARRRAELYAAALGLRVIRIVSVTESGAARAEEAIVVTGTRLQRQGFEANTPIVPGEITARVTTSVSFELH